MKSITFSKCISLFLLLLLLTSSGIAGSFLSSSMKQSNPSSVVVDDTEFWALLIAVGTYYNCPAMDRPTMLFEISRFEEMLPGTNNWDEQHINIIKKEDATVRNIYNGFQWLDEMEDENDVCLIYLTTHGFPIWFDFPPFDENDGMDEALASYYGFLPYESPFRWEHLSNPFGIITDDQFNRWFNRLESNAVGIIVDSCHSGGFNDYGGFSKGLDGYSFSHDFATELVGRNRIVVTSVPEEDLSYGSYFSHHLIDGFNGNADFNRDSQVTMEEAFEYAEAIIKQTTSMNPQIFDNYPGELIITKI